MDRKSKESETIYPDLFFSIDDFEQVKVNSSGGYHGYWYDIVFQGHPGST